MRARRRAEQAGTHFFLLLALLSLGGCSTHGLRKRVALHDSVSVRAVLAYPFAFRWDEPPYRTFDLTHRLVDAGIEEAQGRLQFFGPGEFRIFRADDDHVWAATNALPIVTAQGLTPETVVVLRPWAERRLVSSQQELQDLKGRQRGVTVTQEVTFVGHVEIVHPSTQALLVEISGETTVDPFAERATDFDPTPELTALMDKLTQEAIRTLASHAGPPQPPSPLRIAFNPTAALAQSEEGQHSLQLALAATDPVEAELVEQSRLHFSNPQLSEAQVQQLRKLPGGLWVLAGHGPLDQGDLILSINGQPASPAALARMRTAAQRGALRVRKSDGQEVEVSWP